MSCRGEIGEKNGRVTSQKCGAEGRNRTTDTRIFSPLLYRLSYLGTIKSIRRKPGGVKKGWCLRRGRPR